MPRSPCVSCTSKIVIKVSSYEIFASSGEDNFHVVISIST
jgi:hypothetical protein